MGLFSILNRTLSFSPEKITEVIRQGIQTLLHSGNPSLALEQFLRSIAHTYNDYSLPLFLQQPLFIVMIESTIFLAFWIYQAIIFGKELGFFKSPPAPEYTPSTSGYSGYSSYTTSSKSCSNCGKPVSVMSQAAQHCPHCGVRWSSENTRYS